MSVEYINIISVGSLNVPISKSHTTEVLFLKSISL